MRPPMLRAASLAALLALAGGVGACAPAGTEDDGRTVKVGLSAAFSGKSAYYGQDARKGIELAIEHLGRSMPDVDFDLVTADDECSPQGGASAFRKLADVDGVDAILGSPCSSGTLGGMPTLARSRTPAVTFGSTNAKISQQSGVGGNPYMWRMNIDDSIMGRYWTRYIADAGRKRAAILAANNDFGRGAADLYRKLLPEAGVALVATEFYDLGASDLRPQLSKVRAAGADAFITFAEPPDCAQMLRQMREMGMTLPLYARGGCATAEGIRLTGDPALAEGVEEATYWTASDAQRPLLDGYRTRYGDAVPPYNAALAYYGMLTLAEAVRHGGTDRAGILAGLRKVDFTTGIGPISFDEHHQAHPNMFILRIEGGKIRVLDVVDTGK
ncbi:ABC transporter substrate-binding protein [Micromonospora sagamiensis]|uniref:Branched-chain amino acid transport system substrate-binding protein n=1 Tax=Micromonospora sagamiensis TaxID=47875 RepID=A0A562WEV3_9ACTN|nr:ABC transporter substrate-binding protein [Micromonospora sagamiensis]TWJ28812.1 branched-chain amino acid transport system substrate-binding protein [Micromonospora sagamiensis]BCL12282.1 ABC transporter substrate-binding protein [Micromonospora sagamiensis]